MNYPNEFVGGAIRGHREDQGWTRDQMRAAIAAHRDLGAQFAVSTRTISRAEAGHYVDLRTRFAIATVLGRKQSDLWPDRPKRKPRKQTTRPAVAA